MRPIPKKTALASLAALLFFSPALHADSTPENKLTDQQVVDAMHHAIDYLLNLKKNDNWEADHEWPGLGPQKGGLTALVLYSLLHAGQSLQDDPEYQDKLNWRGTQLAPPIAWLSKNDPVETYSAGLQASALGLLTKRADDKPGEGPRAGLDHAKNYLLNAMGAEGGYDYSYPGASKGNGTFEQACENYAAAKTANDKTALDKARAPLDAEVIELRKSFGGLDKAVQRVAAELNAKRKTADPKQIARIDNELRVLKIYLNSEAPKPGPQSRKFNPVGDLSNGQYGALGAWALMDYGIELPTAYWETTDKFWRLTQKPDGTWPYAADPTVVPREEHPALTVAGIASLFVAQEFVDTQLRSLPKPDKNIDLGLAWLNKNFKPDTQDFYYLYGVERVGLASGLKFFGTADWYKQAAAAILKYQAPDGSFNGAFTGGEPAVATAYALLFLARGRNPVVFNKLQYNGPWNARPRDDAYITRWLSAKRFEKPINWQVVNLQVSSDQWLDAPILLITGSADPKFTREDIAKLRQFVNAGGMIFSTADDASSAFTAAIHKYAADLVDQKYEMRQLPRSHPLFSKELGVDLPNPPPLLGLSNGVREIWIHSPVDLGASWQTRKFASADHFEIAAALYLYSTGISSLRSKLQPLTVDTPAEKPDHTLAVALIDYPGNSSPEPGAWPRMAQLARAHFKTQVNLVSAKFADLDPQKYPLAALTGAARTTFTDADAQSLRAYLDKGGILFADAAGGNPDFADSVRQLLKLVYPKNPLLPVPPNDPLALIPKLEFRKFAALKLGHTPAVPPLETISINNKTAVIFSEYDITSGFLGTKTWGILGYNPDSSEALAKNILLYALTPTLAPPTK